MNFRPAPLILAAAICFNYLQQEFYLTVGTMMALAKGNDESLTLKMISILLNSIQSVSLRCRVELAHLFEFARAELPRHADRGGRC